MRPSATSPRGVSAWPMDCCRRDVAARSSEGVRARSMLSSASRPLWAVAERGAVPGRWREEAMRGR